MKREGPDRRQSRVWTPMPPLRVREAEIARRAYEIFEQRGGGHGRDLDDWLQAEWELRDGSRAR
jgi:hypothetical protein